MTDWGSDFILALKLADESATKRKLAGLLVDAVSSSASASAREIMSEHAAMLREFALKAEVEQLREQFLAENRDALEQEARAKNAEAKLAEAQARAQRFHETIMSELEVRKRLEAELAAARERVWAIHTMLEKFADDLDTGPSTHLLATELRNRWRALRSSEEPKPTAAAARRIEELERENADLMQSYQEVGKNWDEAGKRAEAAEAEEP